MMMDIDTATQLKTILETELSDVAEIHGFYIDWIPEDDSYTHGKSTVMIESVDEEQGFIGSSHYFTKVNVSISIYSDEKPQGKRVKDRIMESLSDYGFKQQQYQQRLDINERGEGSNRELTVVTLINPAFNGIPYFRKN